MLDQPRATSSQPRSELNQSTFNRPQTKYFGIPGPSDGYYSANRTDSRYPQTSEKRSVQPGDGQSKPEVNRLSQSYEQRVFALDEIMTRKSNEEQQTRTRNYEAILRAHENSIQQISSAKFKQDISINSNVQIIGHEFDKELARREYFHKIYTKALDDTKKYVATHINREAARRGVFNHETSIIQQNMKKRDATIDTTIGQWHEAGGAVGGTPISHNFDQRYRPNEMTRQAYNMSMNDLPTRLSNLQVMIQRLENEKQTRNEFNHNIRQFEHKAYSEVTNMMKSEQQRKQSFDQNILSIHQRQEDSRKMVTMYQRERAEVSERTNALLKQEQVRKQIFDNQFNRKYTEQLNIIKAEIEAQKIHAADQHLAELTQHYRDEAAKIAAQIKQSFGM
jgi:hypothetical protein